MSDLCFHSHRPDSQRDGLTLEITPQRAGWNLIHFCVRRLEARQDWTDQTGDREVCLVLLSGTCRVQWEGGEEVRLGPRPHVFAAYPSALYLPPGRIFRIKPEEVSEWAEARVPARKDFPPRVIWPHECGFEIRGGGNASRQIVDILPPEFAADRLLACEVFTPSGNWSSYPPHKHDRDNPPQEVELEEVYYYRFARPEGYGFQRLYTADGELDETVKVRDGDLVLIRKGYHPFVTAYGYDAYYLNFLAGERRSMAASDDPAYAQWRLNWPDPDPRLPLLTRPDRTQTVGSTADS